METKYLKNRQFQSRMKWTGCLVWILLIALFGCGYDGVPVELIGEWETSAPNYEVCTLSIKPKKVIFKKGNSHSLSFKVDGVQVILDGWVANYVFHYKNEDQQFTKISNT